ncbi:hypothetical protein BV20DRAFT_1051655 [Pilatotrama ljubarskyi]|nr:hypothetical protein BV20DRAFT_1051655 [Pilatotrama ljubarskyi]
MDTVSTAIVNEVAQLWMTKINYFAPTAVFCYDYMLTLHREVRLWQRGLSGAALLFCATRYPALLNTIFVIMDLTSWRGMSDRKCVPVRRAWPDRADSWVWIVLSSCMIVTRIEMVLDIIVLTSAAIFSALRVYALCGRDRRSALLVLILGLVSPAIVILTFVEMRNQVIDVAPGARICGFSTTISRGVYENCKSSSPTPGAGYARLGGMIGARTSSVFADLIVLVVTWARILPMRRAAGGLNVSTSLSSILIQDGTMYFLVLLAANVVGLSLIRHLCFLEPMSTWISVLTAIMTSRFILDLREANDSMRGSGSGCAGSGRASRSGLSPSLVFRSRDFQHGDTGIYGTIVLDAGEGEGEEDENEDGNGDGGWTFALPVQAEGAVRLGGSTLTEVHVGDVESFGRSSGEVASTGTSARSSMVGWEPVQERRSYGTP